MPLRTEHSSADQERTPQGTYQDKLGGKFRVDTSLTMDANICGVTLKEKHAKQKKAAAFIVSLMRESLAQFPKDEQSRRIKEIVKIGTAATPSTRGKLSKRSPTSRPRLSRQISSASR